MDIDRKTLKALAADTRLDILKSLGKRRKMPSELSKELNLATSTVVEHLDKLEDADLIKREETGHKWIYYSLTDKGSALVKPRVPTNFVIILGICVLAVFIGFLYYYNLSYSFAGTSAPAMLRVPKNQGTGEETQVTGEKAIATGTMANVTNIPNVTNFTFNVGKSSCSSGGQREIEIVGKENKITFSGSVGIPTPCYETEGSYLQSGSNITIKITSRKMDGVCITCVASFTFDGYLEIGEGHYNVKITHNENILSEKEIDVI